MIDAMNLTDYVRDLDGQATLRCPVLARIAHDADCSPATLYMIARGHKLAGPKLAGKIEEATCGAVTRHDLRPDYFPATLNDKAA